MKLPRDLSGQELIRALCRHWDYVVGHQKGSHVILETIKPRSGHITVPNHNPIRIGTLNGILREVAEQKGVSKQDVLETLF